MSLWNHLKALTSNEMMDITQLTFAKDTYPHQALATIDTKHPNDRCEPGELKARASSPR